jgi:hypothetical protein
MATTVITGKNQYQNTKVVDFYLDRAVLPFAANFNAKDIVLHIVTPRQANRIDLVSYDLYGTSRLWWNIVLLNRDQLKDPIRSLKAGMILRVLSTDAVNRS